MPLEKYLTKIKIEGSTALTLGVFDGVHIGHQHLLSQLIRQAKEESLSSIVITFTSHPKTVLGCQNQVLMITTVEDRLRLLKEQGTNLVLPLPFDQDIAQLSAEEFIDQVKKLLKMRVLVLGPNAVIGRNCGGDNNTLRSLSNKMDFEFVTIPPVKIDGEMVSSSRIRQALIKGDVRYANKMLGRFFSISGPVIKNRGLGRTFGLPTANIKYDPSLVLPANGVYASLTHLKGQTYSSITNIGERPTFKLEGRTVEVHIFNFQEEIYSEMLKIDIIERIREERKFPNTDMLYEQIRRDIIQAEEIISKIGDQD